MSAAKSRYLDIMAMGVSAVCVVHCLALPLLFAVLPFLGAFNESPWVHKGLVMIAAPLCAFALLRSGGWKQHGLVLAGAIGVGLLAVAAFWTAAAAFGTPMSVGGASLLAVMHLINARHGHRREA